MTCTLLLIRHGTTAWNQQGRYQGQADPPLNRDGKAQAERLTKRFAHLHLAAIYSSDLQRAVQTAEPLARSRGLAVRKEQRLRELHFGAWDGRKAEEVLANDLAAWKAWYADPLQLSPPGGETAQALWDRFRPALDEIVREHQGECVAVVTHGGPLRLLTTWMATGRLHPMGSVAAIPNAGWVLLTPAVVSQFHQGPCRRST